MSANSCELSFNLVNLPKHEGATAAAGLQAFSVASNLPAVRYISEHDYSSGRRDQVHGPPPVHAVVGDPFGLNPQHATSSHFSPIAPPTYNMDAVYPQHSLSPSPHILQQSPLTIEMIDAPGAIQHNEESNDSIYSETRKKPPHTIHRYIIVRPGEDGEKATADAINDIAETLNKEAADKIARGQAPDEETVIEVTRIQSPADGYFSRENFLKNRAAVAPNIAALSNSANYLKLEHSTPEKAMVNTRRRETSVKYSNDSRWYRRTPTPPRLGSPSSPYFQPVDSPQLNESCYFNGASTKGFPYRTQHHSAAPCTQTASSLLAASVGAGDDSQSQDGFMGSQNTPPAETEETKKLNDSLTNMQWLEAMNNSSSCSSSSQPSRPESAPIIVQPINVGLSKPAPRPSAVTHRDARMLATERQIDKISLECGRKKRPPFSYMHLIQMAICSKDDLKMTLKQIYQWIEDKFPYYKYHPSQGWRNSIRHNLSLYDIFVREKPSLPGQTGCSYWTLSSDVEPKPARVKRSSSLLTEASSDQRSSSPAFLSKSQDVPRGPVVVMPTLGGGYEQLEQAPIQSAKCVKKGPVPLLPKPAGPVQAYALIPIQGGVPVVPQQPVLVQSMGGNSSYSLHDGSLSKDPLKRNRSPSDIPGGPPKKKPPPKLLAKPNILRPKIKMEGNDSSMFSDSGVGLGSSRSFTNSTNSSINLSQSANQASFLSKNDSGIDAKSLSRSLSDSGETSDTPKGMPKPKMYNRRKSKLVPKCMKGEAKSPPKADPVIEEQAAILNESSISDSGINEILACIEEDLSSPIRNMLRTPPKGGAKNLLTSTPFGGSLSSPSWLSPIKLLTPLIGDANRDNCIITPASGTSKVATSTPHGLEATPSPSYFCRVKNSTPRGLDASPQLKGFTPSKFLTGSPLCFKSYSSCSSAEKSPMAGSLRALGIPGLTPLKNLSPANHNDSFNLTSHSFTRLFGDFHLDNMLEDGMNMDVGNFSFSALQ